MTADTAPKYLFAHIGHKIIAAVGIVVTISLLALGSYYITNQERNILLQNERTMKALTNSVIQGLQTMMLAGYADIARNFADRLEEVPDVVDFRILRLDGTQAFLDNKTIDDVNARRGDEEFLPRDDESINLVLKSDHENLISAIVEKSINQYYETSSAGEKYLTFLAPIENQEDCFKCHGRSKPVRGVLKLTTSLASVQESISTTITQSVIVISVAIIGIILLTGLLIRRTVVTPINTVTSAMARAAEGDLTQSIPVLGKDELSQMAVSFNHMTKQLLQTYTGLQNEQDKLSTIILSAREGIVVTDYTGNVVLINPAAEHLLGKNARQITEEGFLNIIDDPEGLRTLLDRSPEIKEAETIRYNNLVLSIHASTIRSPQGNPIGSAALLRDITEEKRLEERLRRLSTTDGLTGLFNRRHLDETLATEVERSQRYNTPLAILMFDVDHFKRFNDDYGHDQGDRVLQALALSMQDLLRKVDVPCRYGGEEFLAILPGTSLAGSQIVAERLRALIEEMEVDGLHVTISIGVAALPELTVESSENFIELADQALYAAKRAGRNQVVAAHKN